MLRYRKCTSELCWRCIVKNRGQAQNISSSGQSSGKYGKSYLWLSKFFLEESINRELLQRNLHSLKQLLRSNISSLSIKVGNFLGYFLASVILFSLGNPCFWFSILMIYYFNKHGWHSPSFLFHLCNYLTSSRDHLKGDKFHFLPKLLLLIDGCYSAFPHILLSDLSKWDITYHFSAQEVAIYCS